MSETQPKGNMPKNESLHPLPITGSSIETDSTTGMKTEVLSFGNGESIRIIPKEIRIDPSTGEAAKPLFIAEGINGDLELPTTMKAFAEEGQREIIAIRYGNKLQGSTKVVGFDGIDNTENTITEMDGNQARDIARALTAMNIAQVDALGESRGAIRLVAAFAAYPAFFDKIFLAHPAGQDDRSYTEAHLDAIRQGISHAARKVLGRIEIETYQDDETNRQKQRGGRLRRYMRVRKQQRSVAHAKLHQSLDKVTEEYQDKRVIIAGDRHDKAFLPRRLEENKGSHVYFRETQWGGHGIGYGKGLKKKAVKEISEWFLQEERESA
jgi:hypothetical protein